MNVTPARENPYREGSMKKTEKMTPEEKKRRLVVPDSPLTPKERADRLMKTIAKTKGGAPIDFRKVMR